MTDPRISDSEVDELAQCGKYRLIDPPLGEGTFGVVYRAEHIELGSRFYAVKVLRRHFAESPRKVARFRREAQSLARLRHKGLGTVIDWKIERGRPWFSMEYIEGRTLEALIAERHASCPGRSTVGGSRRRPRCSIAREDITRFVEIVIQVATALHHAHEAGVLHRDVKPRNIIVDLSDEPHLVDFGLAKDMPLGADPTDTPRVAGAAPEDDLDVLRTLEWEETGTLPYMPPESLAESVAPIGRRFDVWSLGVTLYECLTGELPFHAPTAIEIRKRIVNDSPAPPLRAPNPRVTRDLEAVVLTALEKDLSHRYGSALEFAEDLGRVLRREPIHARPTSLARRAVFFAQQRASAVLVALAGMMMVSAVLALGFASSRLELMASERQLEAQQRQEDQLIQRLRAMPRELLLLDELLRRETAAYRQVAEMMGKDPSDLETVAQFRFDGGFHDAVGGLEGDLRGVEYVYSGQSDFTPDHPELEGNLLALKLGGNAYVEVADSPALDLDGTFTIDVWIKPEAVGGFVLMKGVVGMGPNTPHNYSIDLVAEGGDGGAGLFVRFGYSGPDVASRSVLSVRPLDLFRWNHVRCQYDRDRGTLSVTLDGDMSPSAYKEVDVGQVPIPMNEWPLTIGVRRNVEFGQFEEAPFIGHIDELRISRRF